MAAAKICAVCQAIPFESLPSEEQTAIPHHATLRELVASQIKGCALCLMILLAVGDTCAAVKHERDGNNDNLPGGAVSFTYVTLPSGKQRMEHVQRGNYMSRGLRAGGGADYNGPMYFDPLQLFPGVEADRLRPWLFGNWWRSDDPDLPLQLVGLGVRIGRTGGIEGAVGNSGDTVVFRGTQIRIRVRHNSRLRHLIPGKLRTAATSSATVKALCQQWMSSCNAKHSCAPPANSSLPTRVLDVARLKNGQIRLVVGASVSARPYVALSHCWGTSHRITTTRDNLDAHISGIPIANLPATFQQAVEVTGLLGIPYLWIDSLCIIQDDARDWEREASKMGGVYANATLIIAADSSTDDSSGCYTTIQERMQVSFVSSDNRALGRISYANAAPLDNTPPYSSGLNAVGIGNFAILDHPPNGYLIFSQEWMPSSFNSSGFQSGKILYRTDEMGATFDPIATENLSTRGWTFQERLLASRTLHLTKGQMYWECSKCMLAEDGGVFPRTFPSLGLLTAYATPSSSSSEETLPWFEISPRIAYSPTTAWASEIWLCMVEQYTARKLTKEEDKLPALSGLARRMANITNDSYHAGLWRRDLAYGLAWRMHVYEPVHFCGNPEHDTEIAALTPAERCIASHPRAWRAPSWSWAAVDGQVEFQRLDHKILVEVVECRTQLAGEDEFGMIEGGFVEVKGPLFEVVEGVSRTRPGDANHPKFQVPWRISDPRFDISGGGYFDKEKVFPSYVLFLDSKAVLLLRERDDGKFERIGCGSVSAGDGLYLPCSTVVIV